MRQPKADAPALAIANAHASEITSVAWHPAGNVIATGGEDAAVKLWDWRRAGGGGSSGGSSTGRGGARSGGRGGGDVAGPSAQAQQQPPPAALLGSYVGHMGAVAKMEFAPGGNWLASAGADGCLIQWRAGG